MIQPQGLIGHSLSGRYRIDELLGHGGMSTVYKGFDPNLKRIVAIKIIHAHLAGDPKFITRFEEEATSVAKLRHPNIVQVYDFNQEAGMYYMVMEFVPGETLQERLRRLNRTGRRMSIPDAIRYTGQVCQATEYAHKHGLIHRDIKPANIILDVHNQAILMDFGIVKIVGGEKHTATGAVVGTALYIPPEMIRGETPDPRSDVYSLGVAFYEMVSGRPPFESDSAMTLMMMHVNDPVPDMRQIRPEVPEELIAVIEKSLAKDRERRFQSMAEMGFVLDGILRSFSIGVEATAIESDQPGWQDSQASQANLSGTPEPVSDSQAGLQGTTMEPGPLSLELGEHGERTLLDQSPANLNGLSSSLSSAQTTPDAIGPTPELQKAPAVLESMTAREVLSEAGDSTSLDHPLSESPKLPTMLPDMPTVLNQPALAISQVGEVEPVTGGKADRPAIPESVPVGPKAKKRPLIWAGGAIVALLIMFALFFAFANKPEQVEGTGTDLPVAVIAATQVQPTETELPSITFTATPILSSSPTLSTEQSLSFTPTLSPIPTVPAGIPYARINNITLDDQGQYVVEYETFEFTEQLNGLHLVFFFDTHSIDQGYMYGGPHPFTKFTQVLRPEDSSQICVLVSNQDHSVRPESGTCSVLPDIVVASLNQDATCLVNPPGSSGDDAELKAGESVLVRGISADESWWNVFNPQNEESTCWLSTESVSVSGDIGTLPLIEKPLAPTNELSELFVEITSITSNNQGQYVIEYITRGFTEQLPGTHIHFYFDTVAPDQVGMSGGGRRLMYGGPSPFTGFLISDKPVDAENICALVATPRHEVIANSGNCLPITNQDIPALVAITTSPMGPTPDSESDY